MAGSRKSIFSGYTVEQVEDFDWWFSSNMEQYSVLKDVCWVYGKESKKKFSMRTVIELLRSGLDPRWRDVNFSVTNSFVPMLQRRLEADRPDLKKYLTPHRKEVYTRKVV
jgi:hypothetical protein